MSDKITFRLWPPYTEKIQEMADAAKLKPNQFARLATISVADGGLLNVAARMQRIEDELIRLRQDLKSGDPRKDDS
ncbi:MAG TPA: hypothetical protein DDW52_00915 [Planctomycetaceae bacterium]|nr:hypothetical protein [Planctomycetaceae bacterium]